MRNPTIAAALAAALALGAAPALGPALAPAAAQSSSGQDLTPEGRGAYVALAGAIDLYSIRAAELALEKAERPEVRAFAETMLADHRQAAEELAAAARAVGLDALLRPAMLARHWADLRRLEGASGARFDRRYIGQQVDWQEIALEMHRHYAANGDVAQLRELAETAAAEAARRLDAARRLER